MQEGAKVVERAKSAAIDIEILGSRNRAAAVHFDLACALSQENGTRDW